MRIAFVITVVVLATASTSHVDKQLGIVIAVNRYSLALGDTFLLMTDIVNASSEAVRLNVGTTNSGIPFERGGFDVSYRRPGIDAYQKAEIRRRVGYCGTGALLLYTIVKRGFPASYECLGTVAPDEDPEFVRIVLGPADKREVAVDFVVPAACEVSIRTSRRFYDLRQWPIRGVQSELPIDSESALYWAGELTSNEVLVEIVDDGAL